MTANESDTSDIQFLGNWSSQQPSCTSFVSAIVLTPAGINASPSDIPQTFSRHQTSVVHVGRAMAADPPVYLDDSATFSNPVMSRKHAKITFADSGSAFIIDTNSHHGTWITRSTAEFKLAAESPFQLQDGDKVTFGKVVQRNGIHHDPLSVTVKLLHSASTPSSMSISSTSVSPTSKAASPRPRNRFGLDPSSDSDSSDNDDSHNTDPSTGPNSIRVELPIHRLEGRNSVSGSPNSSKVSDLVQSEPGTPSNANQPINTPQTSPPLPISSSPAGAFGGFQVDLLPPLGLELDEMGEAVREGSPRPDALQSPTPPWRRLAGTPWSNVNTSIFDRIPDLFQQPPRRLGRLLNPLWVRASVVTNGEERGEITTPSRMLENSGDVIDGMHESHDHHGHGLNHGHHTYGHTYDPHHHGHGGRGFRLDADWGYYGQSGDIKKEIVALSGRLEELHKDLETLKAKGEPGDDLSLIFDRLDELSGQLKNKIAEDARTSQQALFAESVGINALKDSIATLQNDVSALDISLQNDIRSLRANHALLTTDLQRNSENSTMDTKMMTDNVRSLHKGVQESRDEFEALRGQNSCIQQELTTLNDNVSGIHSTIEALQNKMQSTDLSIVGINREIRALTAAHTAAEQDYSARIKEQVQSEVKALVEKEGELSPILGKRKRGAEESVGTSVINATPSALASRPRKRLRVVVDCAAAGALGAISAWLGLAFL